MNNSQNIKTILKEICNKTGYKPGKGINSGGTGSVYKIKKDNNEYAIKIILKENLSPRIKNEIEKSIKYEKLGIAKIFEYDINNDYAYYIMPVYKSITDYSFEDNQKEILSFILQLSKIFSDLSKKKVYHRDIKPNNIVVDKDKVLLIDLGLVKDLNDKQLITKPQDRIGSLTYMAPERIRPLDNSKIDDEKADVFSFGMTIWALITGEKNGIGSQYSKQDEKNSFESRNIDFHGSSSYEELISNCTSSNPAQRPTFQEIYEYLNDPQNMEFDFFLESSNIGKRILPNSSYWIDSDDIINILEKTIKKRYRLEIMIPSYGGWDHISSITKSKNYNNFIEIKCNATGVILLSPANLISIQISECPIYILEAKEFTPFKKKLNVDDDSDWFQSVCELSPYTFTYENCFIYNDYDGKDIPKESKIYNLVTVGKFLIQIINSNENSYTGIIENYWNNHRDEINISLPFLKNNKIVADREHFIFVEPKQFKSRKTLFSKEQEQKITSFINYVKPFLHKKDKTITSEIIFSNLNLRPEEDKQFIANCIQIIYETRFTPPFYFDFASLLNQCQKDERGINYLKNRYSFNAENLLLDLYRLLFLYSNDCITYKKSYNKIYKKIRREDNKHNKKILKNFRKLQKRKHKRF